MKSFVSTLICLLFYALTILITTHAKRIPPRFPKKLWATPHKVVNPQLNKRQMDLFKKHERIEAIDGEQTDANLVDMCKKSYDKFKAAVAKVYRNKDKNATKYDPPYKRSEAARILEEEALAEWDQEEAVRVKKAAEKAKAEKEAKVKEEAEKAAKAKEEAAAKAK